VKFKLMPTNDELQIFYYNRYIVSDKVKTLPYLTEAWSDQVISEYTKVLAENDISIEKALELFEKSRRRDQRLIL